MPSYLASPSTQRKPVKFEMGVYSSTPAAQAQQLYADNPATSAKPLPPAQAVANAQEFLAAAAARAEEREDAEVGLSHQDSDEQTFTEYVPHTFSAAIFRAHPDPVVETASLSSLMPPKTSHKLHLCAKTITQGLLTNLQVPQQSPFPFCLHRLSLALQSADSYPRRHPDSKARFGHSSRLSIWRASNMSCACRSVVCARLSSWEV
jgi:hypothetical protein